MKKLAFVISTSGWGGLEINVLNLARWLRDRRYEIIFYAAPGIIIAERASELGFTIVQVKHRKYFDFIAAYNFARLLKHTNVTTLMAFNNRDLDFIFLTKKFFGKKLNVIYQQHMQIGIEKRDLLHTLRFRAIDYWISPLKMLKQEVIEKTNFDPFKIKVIPLGVDIGKFYPAKYGMKEAREQLGIPELGIFMGILGRIDEKKGQLFLVKAIHELIKKGLNVKLLIMGEATLNDVKAKKYADSLKKYINGHGLSGSVRLLGFSEDVNVFFQAIDIFVLASEAETYGMVTIEAMLSAKPIIATRSGGTEEILGEGKYGFLYGWNNQSDFCDKVKWLIAHSDKTKELALKAQHHALKKYSHHRECVMIEKLLNKNSPFDPHDSF